MKKIQALSLFFLLVEITKSASYQISIVTNGGYTKDSIIKNTSIRQLSPTMLLIIGNSEKEKIEAVLSLENLGFFLQKNSDVCSDDPLFDRYCPPLPPPWRTYYLSLPSPWKINYFRKIRDDSSPY